MREILIINGPNLNLLGNREPAHYGSNTLAEIEADCRRHAAAHDVGSRFFQSNSEGALVDRIQEAGRDNTDFIIINAGAYTHTSVALRDALLAVAIPYIEVHLSNVWGREPFRHHSYLSEAAHGVIVGLGSMGYRLAIEAAAEILSARLDGPIEV